MNKNFEYNKIYIAKYISIVSMEFVASNSYKTIAQLSGNELISASNCKMLCRSKMGKLAVQLY